MGKSSGGNRDVTTATGTYKVQGGAMMQYIVKEQQRVKSIYSLTDTYLDEIKYTSRGKVHNTKFVDGAEEVFVSLEKYGSGAAKDIAQRGLYQIYSGERAGLTDKQRWVIAYAARNIPTAKLASLKPYRNYKEQQAWLEVYKKRKS